MKRIIPISKDKYVKAILMIVNQMGLQMTDLELNIIVSSINHNMKVLNKTTRNDLRSILGLDRFTFNNYIKKLKDKGVLVQSEKDLIVNKALLDTIEDKEVHLIFEVNDGKNGN